MEHSAQGLKDTAGGRRFQQAKPRLERATLKILATLRPGTTMCPGRLARQVLAACGLSGPERSPPLRLLRPVLDALRAKGTIAYSQGGSRLRRGAAVKGPFRVALAGRAPARRAPEAEAALSSRQFDYGLDFTATDFRRRPDLYRVGVGEQGVLLVEPYKSEILPHWRFRTPELALASARAIFTLFQRYLRGGDFVGADMARKFLQMGYTRARRYANHPSGRKLRPGTKGVLPQSDQALTGEKAEAARIFYGYYLRARETPGYVKARRAHVQAFG